MLKGPIFTILPPGALDCPLPFPTLWYTKTPDRPSWGTLMDLCGICLIRSETVIPRIPFFLQLLNTRTQPAVFTGYRLFLITGKYWRISDNKTSRNHRRQKMHLLPETYTAVSVLSFIIPEPGQNTSLQIMKKVLSSLHLRPMCYTIH